MTHLFRKIFARFLFNKLHRRKTIAKANIAGSTTCQALKRALHV